MFFGLKVPAGAIGYVGPGVHVPQSKKRRGKKRKKKKKEEGNRTKHPAEEVEKMERKLSEQNRKRSSTLDAEMQGKSTESESEIPAKKRRPSQSEDGQENEEATKMSSLVHRDAERDVEDGKENTDDSVVKAKRKREEKEEEKLKIGEEVIPSRVLSKKELLMDEDRTQEMSLKKCIDKIDSKEEKTEALGDPTADEKSYKGEKTTSQGPHFTSGVIMKITDSKPLPGRKFIKEALCKLSPVAYVDILEGDSEGHVRFHTPEEAKAVSDAGGELQKEHSWKLEILSGDHEQRYWQKILVDRQVKLNRPREKKRGTEKLIAKAEKIIMARAKEANKHIRFQED